MNYLIIVSHNGVAVFGIEGVHADVFGTGLDSVAAFLGYLGRHFRILRTNQKPKIYKIQLKILELNFLS